MCTERQKYVDVSKNHSWQLSVTVMYGIIQQTGVFVDSEKQNEPMETLKRE